MKNSTSQPGTNPRYTTTRYSADNHPPTEVAAREAFERLTADVERLGVDLDHKDPASFPSREAYETWRRRAIGALGHMRAELSFVTRWLESRNTKDKSKKQKRQLRAPQVSHDDLAVAAIKEKAEKAANGIGAHYVPVYSSTSSPPDIDTARKRIEFIVSLKMQVEKLIGEVAILGVEHSVSKTTLVSMRKPLWQFVPRMEAELKILKAYITTTSVAKNQESILLPNGGIPGRGWRKICTEAINRAIAGGFVLTTEEQAAFERMKGVNKQYDA